MGTEMGGMSPSGGTPERTPVKLDRSDVRRSFWLWTFFSHANYNYERLQGTAFAQAMVPIIKKLYKDPDEIKAALDGASDVFLCSRCATEQVAVEEEPEEL